MICIGENDLRVERFQVLLRLRLDGRGRPHRHERRRFDHAVRSYEAAQARSGRIGRQHLEMKSHPTECIRTKTRRRTPPSPGRR